MTEELYNKIDKFCNETDWSKYPTYEHALEDFIKGIVAEETKELEAQLEAEKKLNEEIKARFVKCNTCTDEMKSKCLMFSEDLCQGERCEELVDLMSLINKSELQKENAELKAKNKVLDNDLFEAEKCIHWLGVKDDQLTKAKELLKRWLRLYNTNTVKGIIADTEKFLNSEGK